MWLYMAEGDAGIVPIVLDDPEPPASGKGLIWQRVAEVHSREDVYAILDRIDPGHQMSR